jgi:hypothetical protein
MSGKQFSKNQKEQAVSSLKFLIERNLVPSKEKLIEKSKEVKKICKKMRRI